MRTLTTLSLMLVVTSLLAMPVQGQDICLPGQCDPPVLEPDASFSFDFSELEGLINNDQYISLATLLGFDDPVFGFDDPVFGFDDPVFGFEASATQAAPVRFAFAIAGRNASGVMETSTVWVSDPVLLVPGTPALVQQGTGPVDTFWEAFDDPVFGFDDPVFGFDDPVFGFDDPVFGFDDPVFGFDDPALGFVIECDFDTPEVAREELEGIWGSGGVAIDTDYALVLAAQPTGRGGGNAVVQGDAAVLPFDLNTSLISNRIPAAEGTVQEPSAVTLAGNYPEPFNPATTIRYVLPEAAHVRLAVYDLTGRRVALLADGVQEAGAHEARFDASRLPSGTYLYRIEAGAFRQTRPMTLVK